MITSDRQTPTMAQDGIRSVVARATSVARRDGVMDRM
jgi:hypothetical protein